MHELTIALNIIEICRKEIENAGASGASEITLEIGALACIEVSALENALRAAAGNTLPGNAQFIYESKEGMAWCFNCRRKYHMNYIYDLCPLCGDHYCEIVQGKEIRIRSIEIF